MVKQKSAARKHDFNCIGSWLCTCKVKSPFEKARALLIEVYDNAKMCPEGHLSLTLASYNVWEYGVGHGKSTLDKEAFKHPAIFPEKLAHDHIISWSNEGDTVLDPFMGSGTTGKQAKLLKRNFIGIECVKEYFRIAKQRIEDA